MIKIWVCAIKKMLRVFVIINSHVFFLTFYHDGDDNDDDDDDYLILL